MIHLTETKAAVMTGAEIIVWPPSGYPDGWTDLGTAEDVQGAI